MASGCAPHRHHLGELAEAPRAVREAEEARGDHGGVRGDHPLEHEEPGGVPGLLAQPAELPEQVLQRPNLRPRAAERPAPAVPAPDPPREGADPHPREVRVRRVERVEHQRLVALLHELPVGDVDANLRRRHERREVLLDLAQELRVRLRRRRRAHVLQVQQHNLPLVLAEELRHLDEDVLNRPAEERVRHEPVRLPFLQAELDALGAALDPHRA